MNERRRAPAVRCAALVSALLAIPLARAAIVSAAAATPPAAASNLRANAQLEPSIAGIDELVTFSVVVESSGFSGLQITPDFALDNFTIVAGPFQSRSQRWVNGETSSSLQLTWRLKPLAVGKAGVKAIRLRVGDETLELAAQEIAIETETPLSRRAIQRPQSPRGAQRSDPFEDFFARAFPERRPVARATATPKLFVRAELSNRTPYVGQQTVYTLWLYLQSDVQAFQPTKLPDFRGFWVREIAQPTERTPEWVEEHGERFGRVPMLRRALFPLQAGKSVIQPLEADVVATISEFGPFGSPFGRNESFHLATEPLTIETRPLPPAAAPAGSASFQGPVGEIALSARLDRTELDAGQAATLTVRCTGKGNLQSLPAPNVPLPDGIRGFPPRQSMVERQSDGALVSSAEWSYVLVPEKGGSFEIGALEIPWFDPAKGEFQLATTEPLRLRVSGPAATIADESAALGKEEDDATGAPEASAGHDGASDEANRRGVVVPAWSWKAAAGAGALALGWLAVGQLRQRGGATSRGGRRRKLLAAIAEASAEGSPRQAAAALEEAWRAHLAERYTIPPSTPVANWNERLAAAEVPSGAAQELTQLAHELHYLRYAPELAAADHLLAEALTTSRRLARLLA